MLSAAFIIIILMLIVLIIHKIYAIFITNRKILSEKLSIENVTLSIEDLTNMSEKEFFTWCSTLLNRLNFTNINIKEKSPIMDNYIIAEKEGIMYTIFCKQYMDLSKLTNIIGNIFLHRFADVLIITSDTLNDDAIKYIKCIPSSSNIEVIDGNSILKTLTKHRDEEIKFYKNLYAKS